MCCTFTVNVVPGVSLEALLISFYQEMAVTYIDSYVAAVQEVFLELWPWEIERAV